jgi:hypothetical protein
MDTSQIINEHELSQVVEKPVIDLQECRAQYIRGYNEGYDDGVADGKDYGYYTGIIHTAGLMCGITAITYIVHRYLERRR